MRTHLPLKFRRLISRIFPVVKSLTHLSELHELWLGHHRETRNTEHGLLREYGLVGEDAKQRLRSRECQVYSQNGEDGILLHLFSQIGTTNRVCVEFGAGGKTSSVANLILNFGWTGYLMDGSKEYLDTLKQWFTRSQTRGRRGEVKFIETWITAENINETFSRNGLQGEIDLLSIDIDGNDYWVWRAITTLQPRVVVIEYNACLGATESLSVPYEPAFDAAKYHPLNWYHGASLEALIRLGKEKGYALVGCESMGINAFFVRKDLLNGGLEEVTAESAFYPHHGRLGFASEEEQGRQVRKYPLIAVEGVSPCD